MFKAKYRIGAFPNVLMEIVMTKLFFIPIFILIKYTKVCL